MEQCRGRLAFPQNLTQKWRRAVCREAPCSLPSVPRAFASLHCPLAGCHKAWNATVNSPSLGASLLCCSVLNAVSVLGGQNPLRLSQNSRESRATGDHVLVRLVLHQVRSTTVLPTPRSGNWARHSSVTWLVGCLPHLVWVI